MKAVVENFKPKFTIISRFSIKQFKCIITTIKLKFAIGYF